MRGHNRYAPGERLAWNYRAAGFDWRAHGLWAPPGGYYWANVDNDFVLAAVATGLVAGVVAADAPIGAAPAWMPPAIPGAPADATPGAGQPAPGAQIVNAGGACLDIQRGGSEPGTPLILFHCHGSPNQSWTLANNHITSALGACLDVRGGTANAGARAIINSCGAAPSQQWALQNGAITGIGGLCLAALDGGGERSRVGIAPCDGSPAQQWSVQ